MGANAFLLSFYLAVCQGVEGGPPEAVEKAIRGSLELLGPRATHGKVMKALKPFLGPGYETNVVLRESGGRLVVGKPGEPGLTIDLVKIAPGRKLVAGEVFDPSTVVEAWSIKTEGAISVREFAGLREAVGKNVGLLFVDRATFFQGKIGWLRPLTADAVVMAEHMAKTVEAPPPPPFKLPPSTPADPKTHPLLRRLLDFVGDPEVLKRLQDPAVKDVLKKIESREIAIQFIRERQPLHNAFARGRAVYLYEGLPFGELATLLPHEGLHARGFLKSDGSGGEVQAYRATRDFVDVFLRVKGIDLGGNLREFDAELVRRIPSRELAQFLRGRWPQLYAKHPYLLAGRGRPQAPPRALGRGPLDNRPVTPPAQGLPNDWARADIQRAKLADPVRDPRLVELLEVVADPTIMRLARNQDIPRVTEMIASGEMPVYFIRGSSPYKVAGFAHEGGIYIFESTPLAARYTTLVHEGVHALGYREAGRYGTEVQAFRAEAEIVHLLKSVKYVEILSPLDGLDPRAIRDMSGAELAALLKQKWPQLYEHSETLARALTAKPSRLARLGRGAAREAKGAATFAAGYLIKEGFNAIETGDPARMGEAARNMFTPEFAGAWALFTGVAHGVGRGLDAAAVKAALARAMPATLRTVARSYLPMAAAIPLVEIAFGERDAGRIARTTAIFTALGVTTDLPVLLGMIAVPGPGTLFGAAYFAVKLGVMLWLGEKLDREVEAYSTEGKGWFKDVENGIRRTFAGTAENVNSAPERDARSSEPYRRHATK